MEKGPKKLSKYAIGTNWIFQDTRLFTYYNQLHNILRFLDVLPNFTFTTRQMMYDYYL